MAEGAAWCGFYAPLVVALPRRGPWATPRWPAGVSGAVAGRAAMDAGHVANATGRARRRRRRALILKSQIRQLSWLAHCRCFLSFNAKAGMRQHIRQITSPWESEDSF